MSRPSLAAEMLAEFLGTFVLLLFGLGVNASVTLFGTGVPGEVSMGGYTNITLGWGLGVVMGIYVAGRITGAHLNPAVTVALAVFRNLGWGRVLPYIVAQTAGAFVAAALVFWNYRPAFQKFDSTLEKTAGVFGTFPAFPGLPFNGFLDQVIGTALLMLLIFAVTDDANQSPKPMTPFVVGLIVVAIGISFGGMHGYAINPARDLGPRLFTAVAGFPKNGLTDGSGVFWIPVIGPLVGGLIGAALYDFAIRPALPKS
jgi:glycerol uptake facilitator protein